MASASALAFASAASFLAFSSASICFAFASSWVRNGIDQRQSADDAERQPRPKAQTAAEKRTRGRMEGARGSRDSKDLGNDDGHGGHHGRRHESRHDVVVRQTLPPVCEKEQTNKSESRFKVKRHQGCIARSHVSRASETQAANCATQSFPSRNADHTHSPEDPVGEHGRGELGVVDELVHNHGLGRLSSQKEVESAQGVKSGRAAKGARATGH